MVNPKRDYKQEWATATKRGEADDNNTRHRARYAMEQAGKAAPGDGRDVGHKQAIKRGGSNAMSNLEMQSPSANRSFARNAKGAMVSETARKERK